MTSLYPAAAAKLALGLLAPLMVAGAIGRAPHRSLRLTATQRVSRWSIPGSGRNIWIQDVRADGRLLTLTQNNNTSAPLYIYGDGVVVAVIERGRHWTLRAVSVQGRQRVTLTYWITG